MRGESQDIRFIVDGRPVPWSRTGRNAQGRRYSPRKMVNYQRVVARAAYAQMAVWRLRADRPWLGEGAFGIECIFYTSPPLPDTDNCLKCIKDALQPGVYDNDRFVDETHAFRRIDADRPRAEIRVWRKGT